MGYIYTPTSTTAMGSPRCTLHFNFFSRQVCFGKGQTKDEVLRLKKEQQHQEVRYWVTCRGNRLGELGTVGCYFDTTDWVMLVSKNAVWVMYLSFCLCARAIQVRMSQERIRFVR